MRIVTSAQWRKVHSDLARAQEAFELESEAHATALKLHATRLDDIDAKYKQAIESLKKFHESRVLEIHDQYRVQAQHLKAEHLQQLEDAYDEAGAPSRSLAELTAYGNSQYSTWDEGYRAGHDDGWQDGFSDGCEAMSDE